MHPTTGQLALLSLSALLYLAGLALSLRPGDRQARRVPAKVCYYLGMITALVTLVWHALGRGAWVPLDDNFETLVWLGLLLSGFVMYMQRRRPIGGLDWFVMPIVVVLLVLGGIFGYTKPHPYAATTWSTVHRVTTYGGALGFAIAGAVGTMYLINNRRLRRKLPPRGSNLGSLERLEHTTRVSVTAGFALLTVGLITGVVWISYTGPTAAMGPRWFASPKVLLAVAVWLVYALVLHAPINPSFRGRRTAQLSVLGFLLMLGAIVAVQFMPGAGGGAP